MCHKVNPLLKIALTANLFEWYEFSLTAFMALEIGRLFFPFSGDETALLLSFAVFSSSYLARPIGGVFFGVWGNRRGASAALRLSLVIMALPAVLIAFLPTYETAGYLATGFLVGLKILQGFAAGGELPLSGYVVSLHTSNKERGLYCACVAASGFLGMLLASAMVFSLPHINGIVLSLSNTNFGIFSESWRWPFLLCIPLSIFVYVIRSSISLELGGEIQAFRKPRKRPLAPLLQAAVLVAFMEILIYMVFVWLPSYLHTYIGVSTGVARITNVITLLIFCMSMLAFGYATRWFEPSKFVLLGTGLLIISSYPLFSILQSGTLISLLFAQVVFALMGGCVVGVIFIVLPDLFKNNWQTLGMTVSYSLPTAIFGGTAPLVGAYLIELMRLPTAPALYIIVMGLIAAPVAINIFLKDVSKNDKSKELHVPSNYYNQSHCK